MKDPEWMVLTADETRIQLEAEIRKAWLRKGERTVVKTEKSKEHQNYLGFLDQRTGQCQVHKIQKGRQEYIIPVLKKLVGRYKDQRVCLIWDNASCHKGTLLRGKLKKGNSLEKLHLVPLPPYASETNPIEHVFKICQRENCQ